MSSKFALYILLGALLPQTSWASGPQTKPQLGADLSNIDARVLTYVEEPYTATVGEFYDRHQLGGPSHLGMEIDVPGIDSQLPLLPPRPETVLPEPIFDVSSGVSLSAAPAPGLGVGATHLVATTAQGVFGFAHDGTSVLNTTLAGFFAPLSPASATEPRVVYDDDYDRFVVLALDVDNAAPDADLLLAVSDDTNPAGTWFYVRIPLLVTNFDPDGAGPQPSGPHVPTNPMVGLEKNQIYIAFNMRPPGSNTFSGTAVWNVWKWQVAGSTGLYAGNSTVTIQAALRPFGVVNDYGNEVPLTPVNIVGESPAGSSFGSRGMFLAGYGGKSISGSPALQIFWIGTVGPTVSKMVVPLGAVDANFGSLPAAPQPGGGSIPTGTRNVHSAMWIDEALWLVTTVEPPGGPDAGQATAHWVAVDAPATSGLTLRNQGDISADQLLPNTSTFNPSIVNIGEPNQVVAVSYSASSPELPLSSMISFIRPNCDEPEVALAPDFLRVGSAPWAGQFWGPISGTGGEGSCVWSHNAHSIAGGGGAWASSVGRYCVDVGLIFQNSFETGSTNGWCLTTP